MSDEIAIKYLVKIEPLGMLYGSAGPFLSPENLVGRAGNRFPPSASTVAGLYAAQQWEGEGSLNDLTIVGPFWAEIDKPLDFYVPTPLNFRVKPHADDDGYQIAERWQWTVKLGWHLSSDEKEKKSLNNSWVCLKHWHHLQAENIATPIPVIPSNQVWKYHPHLHPRLEDDERHVVRPIEDENDLPAQQGSLFLENGVQIHPDRCLVYLSSRPIEPGWYRFGGEGHLAQVTCIEIPNESTIAKLMQQPMGDCFSLLVPAVWGTQRLSYRFPVPTKTDNHRPPLYPMCATIQSPHQSVDEASANIESFWSVDALMTERPIPFRFRLGGTGKVKRLSRGRYAVPAGTVYQVSEQIPPWQSWQQEWFPTEAYSYKNWGCGFALPLTPPTNH
jgi:CRISPR-associated protein Cmr3